MTKKHKQLLMLTTLAAPDAWRKGRSEDIGICGMYRNRDYS